MLIQTEAEVEGAIILISPDPMAVWWELDRRGEWWELNEVWHEDDQNLLQYRDIELRFASAEQALVIDV